MKRTNTLAVIAVMGFQAAASMAATTMTKQNVGEEYKYTADDQLTADLAALRTGFYDQNINLPEKNNGIPMESRPQFMIHTSQPFTGLYPISTNTEGNPIEPLIIYTTGGQSSDLKQGEAYMMVRLNISPKDISMEETAGKRLLLTKAYFNVKTEPGHSRNNSQVYVSLYCGNRLLNTTSTPIQFPVGPNFNTAIPQVQLSDFDFANCRDDVNVYYVADAQVIQFKYMTWMISEGPAPVAVPDPVTPPVALVAMCQYKHKENTSGGKKGDVNFADAHGTGKTCDAVSDWKTSCKDGDGKTDEIACAVPQPLQGGMCQYKHKKDTKGGKKDQTNAFDANGKQKSCTKNGDGWKTTCKDGNGDTDEVACQ